MRSSFPAATRAAYMAGDIAPKVRATIRRTRLDFQDNLYHENEESVIVPTADEGGDDYFDLDGGTYNLLWGDSCVHSGGQKVRICNSKAWAGSHVFYTSLSTSGSDDWTYAAIASGGVTLANYVRVGVYPSASANEVFVWYLDDAQDLYRRPLNTSTWTWGTASTSLNLSGIAGAALHPISETEAILVAYDDPYMWVKYLSYNTVGQVWTDSTADWIVYTSDQLLYSDSHWSDAVMAPTGKVVVGLNLFRWGSTHVVTYDTTSGVWSQPREMLPSAEQWGNLQVRLTGMSVINSRIWAVTVREPVASGDVRMAHHVALTSSVDGIDWRDEDFVTTSTLRGKLLYSPGEDYCYVAGNTSVARASATNKLGHDASAQKHVLEEITAMNIAHAGPGSAPTISLSAINADDAISGSGLLEAAAEVTVELGATGYDYGTLNKGFLMQPLRSRGDESDEVQLDAVGRLADVVGETAYRPIAAKVYDGPYYVFSKFISPTGSARLTVRQETGKWNTKRLNTGWVLECSESGISLLPHEFTTQTFFYRMTFKTEVSTEGVWVVFWWKDESNYWRAGVYNDAGTYKLQIRRIEDGVDSGALESTTLSALSTQTWYTLYADARPGQIRVYFNNSESYDYSSPTASESYDTSQENTGPPNTHHVGMQIDDFEDFEGALLTGTVTSLDDRLGPRTYSLYDSAANFNVNHHMLWVRCHDQTRRIKDTDPGGVMWVSPTWSDELVVGEAYGIYTDNAKGGPRCHVKELWACEGRIPYNVQDIMNNILSLCGVSVTDVYTASGVGTLSSDSPVMNDIDITLSSATSVSTFVAWASTDEVAGDPAYSGLTISVGASTTTLSVVENGASTEVAVHPNMIPVPSASKELRLQANEDAIVVSMDRHIVNTFPNHNYWPGGYVARSTAGTAWRPEFVNIMDSFIWDANEPAASAIARLAQGRRAKLVERSDGSVAVSRFDSPGGDVGTYTTPVLSYAKGEDARYAVSIVEMVGAEERAFYIHEPTARRRLRYMRHDNPTVESQEAAYQEGRKAAVLDAQRLEAAGVTLYAPDPSIELEDAFSVKAGAAEAVESFIADQVMIALQSGEDGRPAFQAGIMGRQQETPINYGVWGTPAYDDGTEYG